jgi:hypothetical protein
MKYLPLIFLLTSCAVGYHHAIVDGTRKEEYDASAQLGAVTSQKGSDGYSYDADAQKSLSDVGTAAVGYITAKGYTKVQVAKEHTNQLNSPNSKGGVINNSINHSQVVTPTVDPTTGQVLTPQLVQPSVKP